MHTEKINLVLLVLLLLVLGYVAFYQPAQQKAKMKYCFDSRRS